MRAFWVLFLATPCLGCGSASSLDDPQEGASTVPSGGTCSVPSAANTFDSASGVGCRVITTARACNPNTGVCTSLCEPSDYELDCTSSSSVTGPGPIPGPTASLGCGVIPIPTPPGVTFYCCPCE